MILNVLGQSLVVERVHAEMLCESNSSILVVRLTEHERQESSAQIIRLLRGWPINYCERCLAVQPSVQAPAASDPPVQGTERRIVRASATAKTLQSNTDKKHSLCGPTELH